MSILKLCFFFFQAEDGIRDLTVTGVQTCALPISERALVLAVPARRDHPLRELVLRRRWGEGRLDGGRHEVGRAAGRGRGEISGGAGSFKKKKERSRGDFRGRGVLRGRETNQYPVV